MAKEKVSELQATELTVGTQHAVESINKLKSAVKDSTNEWKVMESQMKQSGDAVGASEAKYKGLTQSVSNQENMLQKLRQEQSEVNRSTEAGEQTYQKYATQITTAERQLASMTRQQEQAKRAYEMQESGIAGLNKEIQNSIKETDAYVDRLKAEGKEEEALKAQKEGLSRTLDKQSKLYEAQSKELEKLSNSGEASADSISKQKIALDKTATSIAKNKNSLSELDGEQGKLGKNNGAEEAGSKMERFTGKISKSKAGLVAMGATAGVVLAGVAKGVKAIYDSQAQVNTLQGMTTLSYSKSKESITAINKLYAQGYGESMDELQETYAKLAQVNPNASVKELAENTKLVSTYAKQSGADTEEVMQGAQNATKAWGISYQEYFDNMTMLQKRGDDVGGDLSDNMAEYSQVLGQMGLSVKDSMALIDNGVKSGAYNADKLLDFTKEFSISLNDGRMDKSISEFSKKSQDMFKGYKEGKVSAGDMFKQITGEMGKMTDKQKEATIASNLWSALGEDNSLKVIGSLGKTNKAFDNVKGTADKTSKQLKESNPFELLKRGAEASMSSMTMSATQTKNFNKALKPLQKAVNNLLKSITKSMPSILKAITPVINFVANHSKLVIGALAGILAIGFGVKAVKGIQGIVGAFKALNLVMKLNPVGLIIAGITAVVVGLTTLYKHNKKFRNFVNGLVSAAANFAKGVLKWFGKAWSNISSFFKKVINFVKKDWKEILLYIVNPFAGAFALIYKHNAKFRKAINNLVKTVINYFKNMGKNISNIFNDIKSFIAKTLSSIGKTWNKAWKSISNFFNKVWKAIKKTLSNVLNTIKKTLVSSLNAYIKLWSKAWKSVSKTFSNIWNGIKKFLRSMLSWLRNAIDDAMDFVYKIWHKGWNKISSLFSNTWRSMKRVGHDAIWSLKNTFDSVLGKIHKAFSNTWKGIKRGFSDMWQGMKVLAGKGINAVIKIPNAGISGINGLIHDFGGPKHAISHIPSVKYATGTGMFSNVRKAITKPTLALLNDGNDSPGTGNQETLIHPNGAMELVQGRNTKRILAPGTEVLNASETAMMLGIQAMPFKSGTGFWSGVFGGVTKVAGNVWNGMKNGVKKFTEMFKFITNAVAHPVKTLQDKFNPSAKGLAGMFDSFGTAMFKKPKSQAKNWWKTLWSMANDASSAGADGGMKGDDYRFKNRVADSGNGDPWGYFFKECVSFVASRLANSGVPASKFSHLGNGSDWVNAPVRHTNNPKPGMVAVYGPGSDYGNHAAMVTGVQGNKISGEEYNFNYNHKYHQYHGRNASGATTFLDFGLSGSAKAPEVKTNSPLAKLIKRQTGGMMKWIQKFISPLNNEDGSVGGGTQALPSGSHKHWLEQAGIHGNFDKWNYIINHESSWNPRAKNPSSDAYGIGQALPPSKMASFGSDYMSNPITQLKWMKSYVNGRYGGINEAYRFWQRNHWYENGGIIDKDSIIRVAEKNKPEMIIPLAGDNVRANQLLDEASLRINGKKNSDDGLIEKLLAKKDSGDTYEININVNADVTPNAIKKIQQAVEDAITRKQNARTRAFG